MNVVRKFSRKMKRMIATNRAVHQRLLDIADRVLDERALREKSRCESFSPSGKPALDVSSLPLHTACVSYTPYSFPGCF
jgi:hypothetical protein